MHGIHSILRDSTGKAAPALRMHTKGRSSPVLLCMPCVLCRVAYIGDPDGEMQIVDLRAGDLVRPGIVTHLK